MLKRFGMTTTLCLMAIAVFSAPPEEEQFGDRIYFRQDGFELGDYLDYFQNPFAGYLKRNMEGRNGYCCDVTYGEIRPIKVEPGKKYRLEFYAFNKGAKTEPIDPKLKQSPFPFSFNFYDDAWKVVKQVKGMDIPDAEKRLCVPASWEKYSFEIEVPENSSMFTFSISSAWKNRNGSYLIDDVTLTEIKDK